MYIRILVFSLYFWKSFHTFPILNANEKFSNIVGIDVPPPDIIKFMRRFGYLDPIPSDSEAMYHESAIIDAIKNIQLYGALNQSGILDEETLKLFVAPRCGVPDILFKQSGKRLRRYILGSKIWQKRKINYFIANWSPKIGEDKISKDMQKVFEIWSSYSNLKFKRIYDPSADIIIAFGSRYHGDSYPFDGPGNILAHAYYPYEMESYGGDIHFDDDENWKENSTNLNDGVDFFSVALHELGHSLGLAHSPVYSSIMFPYYKGPNQNTLDYDDIMAMYNLYIKGTFIDDTDEEDNNSIEISTLNVDIMSTKTIENRASSMTSTTPYSATYVGDYETVDEHRTRFVPTTTGFNPNNFNQTDDIPNICIGSFDAVSSFQGRIHIFKGKYIWKLTQLYRIENGYPVKLRDIFKFLPETIEKIDAAYERNYDNAIVLFTGKKYWVYKNHVLIENSPQPIINFGLSDNITGINAAMFWPKNSKTYIFSGNEFWRYDDYNKTLDQNYPKNMDRWIGIPNDINAAVTTHNGKTYFFKDNFYWLYNNILIRPERGYPRRSSNAWLGCPLMQRRIFRNFH